MLLTFVRGIALDPADDITGDCLGYFFPFHSYFIALAVLGKAGIACPSMKCSVTVGFDTPDSRVVFDHAELL